MDVAAIPRSEFVPTLRFSGALPLAALATASLIYGMHLLVKTDYVELEETTTVPVIDIVMPENNDIPTIIEPPQKVDEPLPEPDVVLDEHWTPPSVDGGINITVKTGGIETIKPTIGYGSGGLVKQVMLAPEYPRHALTRGIEGFVDVEYDVTSYGATSNLRVLHAQPEGVFERAALAAVAKWKFRPQIVDEEAVATYGLKERLRFTIEK